MCQNLNQIDVNKDRHEAALFSFTIVTVIFLPLSTVATILGMNTSDVRSMDEAQWLFWSAALPLMLVIVGLVLAFTGVLSGWGRRLADALGLERSSWWGRLWRPLSAKRKIVVEKVPLTAYSTASLRLTNRGVLRQHSSHERLGLRPRRTFRS